MLARPHAWAVAGCALLALLPLAVASRAARAFCDSYEATCGDWPPGTGCSSYEGTCGSPPPPFPILLMSLRTVCLCALCTCLPGRGRGWHQLHGAL